MKCAHRGVRAAAAALWMCLFAIGGADVAYGQQGGSVLKIGIAVPMSGITARVGDETSKVAQWWAKKVKDEYKINVEVVIRDTSFRPADAINAVERLVVEDKVSAIAGIWHSAQGVAVVPVINRLKVPLVIMGASSPKVMYSPDNITQKEFVWRPSIDDSIKGRLVGDFLVQEVAPKFKTPPKVFYIGEDTDFARDFLESTREFIAKNGQGKLENVGSTLYFAPSSTTLVSELAKVRAASPQIVVTAPSGGVMAVFTNEMRQLRVPAVDVGYAGEAAAKEFVELTGDNRWGTTFILYTTPGKPMTPKTLAWEEQFRKAIPEYPVPAGYSAILWECLETIRLAAEIAGSTDPVKINAAIPKVKFEGVRNPLVQYDPKTHDTTEMFVAMAQYQQGKPGSGLTVIWPRQVKDADFILPKWVQQ